MWQVYTRSTSASDFFVFYLFPDLNFMSHQKFSHLTIQEGEMRIFMMNDIFEEKKKSSKWTFLTSSRGKQSVTVTMFFV
jgi:hypothetical protein